MSSLFVAIAPSSFSQQKTKNHSSFSPHPLLFSFPKTVRHIPSLAWLRSHWRIGHPASSSLQCFVGQKMSSVIMSHFNYIQKQTKTIQAISGKNVSSNQKAQSCRQRSRFASQTGMEGTRKNVAAMVTASLCREQTAPLQTEAGIPHRCWLSIHSSSQQELKQRVVSPSRRGQEPTSKK